MYLGSILVLSTMALKQGSNNNSGAVFFKGPLLDLVKAVRTAQQMTTSFGDFLDGPALVLLAMCLDIDWILSMGNVAFLLLFFLLLNIDNTSYIKIFFKIFR
jgi:hypothetical protein